VQDLESLDALDGETSSFAFTSMPFLKVCYSPLPICREYKEQWHFAAFIPGYSGGTAAALPHSALLKMGFFTLGYSFFILQSIKILKNYNFELQLVKLFLQIDLYIEILVLLLFTIKKI